jgi:hypothetical protein
MNKNDFYRYLINHNILIFFYNNFCLFLFNIYLLFIIYLSLYNELLTK